MASVPYKFNTTASTNLQPVRASQAANLKAVVATNTSAAIQYIKIYWFIPTAAAPVPVVGTTIPSLVFAVPATTGAVNQSFPDGVTGQGQMWVAVTGAQVDTDATATAVGGVVTLCVE